MGTCSGLDHTEHDIMSFLNLIRDSQGLQGIAGVHFAHFIGVIINCIYCISFTTDMRFLSFLYNI